MSKPNTISSDGKAGGRFIRGRAEACSRCNYDLRGRTSSTCPECGYLVGLERLSRKRRMTQTDVLHVVKMTLIGVFLSMMAIVVMFQRWSSVMHQALGMVIIIALAAAPYFYMLVHVLWRTRRQ